MKRLFVALALALAGCAETQTSPSTTITTSNVTTTSTTTTQAPMTTRAPTTTTTVMFVRSAEEVRFLTELEAWMASYESDNILEGYTDFAKIRHALDACTMYDVTEDFPWVRAHFVEVFGLEAEAGVDALIALSFVVFCPWNTGE